MKCRPGVQRILKWARNPLVAFVAMILVANTIFVWITGTRLDNQLAAIRAAGDPLSIADLAPKPIPPEQNAATYLQKAQADCTAIDSEFSESPGCRDYISREYPMPPQVRQVLKDILEAHAEAFPLLDQAAACRSYDARLDYSLPLEEFSKQSLNIVMNFRDFARALQPQAELLVAEGKYDDAVRTSLVLFRLSRLSEQTPGVLAYLVANVVDGIAIHSANLALQTGQVSPPVCDALDAELAIHERLDSLIWALKCERAYVLDRMRTFTWRNCWFIGRPIWNWRTSRYLEAFNEYFVIMANPGSYTLDEKATRKLSPKTGIIRVHECAARARARIRSLRVLNALHTHVAAGSDDVPELSKLGLPVETTIDPFTGSSLHVKKTPRGWLVYSVGPNLRDDGGKLVGDAGVTGDDWDVGVGPPSVGSSAEK